MGSLGKEKRDWSLVFVFSGSGSGSASQNRAREGRDSHKPPLLHGKGWNGRAAPSPSNASPQKYGILSRDKKIQAAFDGNEGYL